VKVSELSLETVAVDGDTLMVPTPSGQATVTAGEGIIEVLPSAVLKVKLLPGDFGAVALL
jgi:hypothetical protein